MRSIACLALCLLACAPRDAAPDEPPVAAPRLAVACDDALATLGAADVAPATDALAARGAIVGCAHEARLDAAALRAHARRTGATPALDPPGGAHVLRIAYRTTRRGDVPAVATARVILPDRTVASPAPLAVVAHGTVGLADGCAPSRAPLSADVLALPWAARGWPVIAPDYAGLGSDGVQGYGDGDDTARSVLDAARALRALLPEGTLSASIVLAGHSQGGGAVLSSQALERRYGAGGRVVLAVAIAPGWPVVVSADPFRDPARRTAGEHALSAVVAALFLSSWHARRDGTDHAGDGFDAAHRAALVRALDRGCIGSLLGSIPHAAPSVGALIDDALRRGLIACADGDAAGCTGRARELHAWMEANIQHGDPEGAPIHVLVGAADAVVTPARARCIVDHLRAGAAPPSVCVLPGDHLTMLPGATRRALDLARAALDGAAPPPCEHAALPTCALAL